MSMGHTRAPGRMDSGESWFMNFHDVLALGRVCHLQPVTWVDDWPVMGCDGEPVSIYNKPDVGKNYPRVLPQTSDDFNGTELGLQWQWNHNPVNEKWSLTERPGYLRLKAMQAENLLKAKNTLTQKLMGTTGNVHVELNFEGMQPGRLPGLAFWPNGRKTGSVFL